MSYPMHDYITARDHYILLVKEQLLGPGSEVSIPDAEHELITDSPEQRYSIGILFPRNNKINADNDDTYDINNVEPGNVTEKNDEMPDDTMLHSKKDSISAEHNSGISEDGNLDEEIELATQNKPSSFGMTFLVSNDINKMQCTVDFATYRKAKKDDCAIPFLPEDKEKYTVPDYLKKYITFNSKDFYLQLKETMKTSDVKKLVQENEIDQLLKNKLYRLCYQLSRGYVRVPHELKMNIEFSEHNYVDCDIKIDKIKARIAAIKRRISEHVWSVTIMLINDNEGFGDGATCLFQPCINVSSADNDFRFREYSALADFNGLSLEEKSLEMQYRNKKVYGTGLGTSVDWQIDCNGSGTINTEFFPESEVPSMDFNVPKEFNIDGNALSMRYLSDLDTTDKEKKIEALRSIVAAYKKWIETLKKRKNNIDSKYSQIADVNIKGCTYAATRMDAGINTLENNADAWNSFMLANRAMFMQRVHLGIQGVLSDKDRFNDDEELSEILQNLNYTKKDGITADNHKWRLFQIAFLLMSINSIVLDESEDRKLVDLIWFPTGGGKTEAYLGLTAFTIFFRRMSKGACSGGTAVIMRYTLRLLAAQQFTRAATLICACELIRADATSKKPQYGKYKLGDERITIGLWIGNEHIPNKIEEAKKCLKALTDATTSNLKYAKEKNNKFQILKCPWCGTKMVKEVVNGKLKGEFGYQIVKDKFGLTCQQEACFFNSAGTLPIQIIDENLYKDPPTLLFGTVDKFAMMPWKKDIANFFGNNSEPKHIPPSLIIQDELHLISGPLGTIVGLYECAIDKLCEHNGVLPKVVASTATIRRAKEQCASLYNREVNQFPHPGLNAEDSFFAREAVIDSINTFGRKYIGLMPSGKTKAMMEIRAISSLMEKIKMMKLEDEIKDKYWTLTVYFNSLKDLGKCSTLVADDVKDSIGMIAKRFGDLNTVRYFSCIDELTSRVTTTQLNETLEKLEKTSYSSNNTNNEKKPADILLATNMISVGIDVARLNVMLLVGQPKLTSEYIQASSRVGRTFPGVAFAMYDGGKSRDRSHYEQFKAYHESFYKYVEPTGVTPFSRPARDRALHAVVIALVRALEQDLAEEEGASNFSREKYAATIKKIRSYIVERAKAVNQRVNPNMNDDSNDVEEEIDYVLKKWETLANDCTNFNYGEKSMVSNSGKNGERLLKMFNTRTTDTAFDTLTAMRNVDTAVPGNVIIWED